MMECNKIENLLEELSNKKIVSIDGVDGSGKTYLSNELKNRMNCVVLHLDCDKYLLKDKGNYVRNLKLDAIKQDIINSKKPLIVEGACLQEIFNKLEIKPDYRIYVKKINERGEWLDEEECNIEGGVEDLVQKLEQQIKSIFPNFQGLTSFRKEVIVYHKNYKPFEGVDCTFIWIKCN